MVDPLLALRLILTLNLYFQIINIDENFLKKLLKFWNKY